MKFLDKNKNIILIGNPDTGKTALSKALGMKSYLSNKKVLFVNALNLLIKLEKAIKLNQINKYKTKFEKYDLINVDELGYCFKNQISIFHHISPLTNFQIQPLFISISFILYHSYTLFIFNHL